MADEQRVIHSKWIKMRVARLEKGLISNQERRTHMTPTAFQEAQTFCEEGIQSLLEWDAWNHEQRQKAAAA